MTNQNHHPHGGTPGASHPGDGGRGPLFHAVLAATAVLVTGVAAAAVLFATRDGGERDDTRAAPPTSAAPRSSPAEAPDGDWPVLPALPADTAPTVPAVNTKTRIAFENHTTDVYVISWLDTDGEVTEYTRLAPGRTYVQDTYAGHYWAVAVSGGETTAVFLAEERPGRAVIER